MNVYRNIINGNNYTLRFVEAVSPIIEATPYMIAGEILKYPAISAEADYFVKLSAEAIQAYNNSKTNL
jgi:hypothetical protein